MDRRRQRAWAAALGAALWGALACSSDGKTAAGGGATPEAGAAPPAYQSVCEAEVKLPCSHQTLTTCMASLGADETAAASAGCTTEWSAALACRKQHPDFCSGAALLPDGACRAARDAEDACVRGLSTGADRCNPPKNACDTCECNTCTCNADCATGQQAYNSCVAACRGSATLLACLGACDGSTSPAFQAYVDCYANSCQSVCAAGGGTGP